MGVAARRGRGINPRSFAGVDGGWREEEEKVGEIAEERE